MATISLVAFGWRQTLLILEDAKTTRTMAACDRYSSDPIIDRSLRRLRRQDMTQSDPLAVRIDHVTILNYLDVLAIGVERKLYDEEFVYSHMREMVAYHSTVLVNEAERRKFGLDDRSPELDYGAYLSLVRRWADNGAFNDHLRWKRELAEAEKRMAARQGAAKWSA